MLPPHDQGPTLIDTGEFESEGFAFRGLPITWDSGDDGDDEDDDEKATCMIAVPPAERSSQRLLRVLPAVPPAWTPPPPPPSGVLPPMNPPPAFRTSAHHRVIDHWVPDPPPSRDSYPSEPESLPIFARPAPPQPFTSLELPDEEVMIHGVGPHVAVTLQTPRTRAKRQRILRKVILPWPAVVMVAAVAGGVIFEHVQRGDTLSTIASTARSAQNLVRR